MKRLLLAAVAAIPLFTASFAAATAETVLKLGHTLPTDSHFGVGERAFAAELARLLPGQYRIEEQPAAKLGSDADMIKALQLGTLEMMIVGGGGAIGDIVPEAAVLDLPFLFRDYAQIDRVLAGPIGTEILAAHESHGVIAIGWGEQGMRQITSNERQIRTAADLRGMKIRVPQSTIYLAAFRNLGADAQSLPFNAVYSSLKTGVIDGQENPILSIVSAKLYEVQKRVALTQHIYSVATFLVSPDVWGEMSDAEKAAFRQAAAVGGQAMRTYIRGQESDGLKVLRDKGIEVTTDIDRDSFIAAVAPSYATLPPAQAALVRRIRDTN